jgi:hypothetical protein
VDAPENKYDLRYEEHCDKQCLAVFAEELFSWYKSFPPVLGCMALEFSHTRGWEPTSFRSGEGLGEGSCIHYPTNFPQGGSCYICSMIFCCDSARHLVCLPYSRENLHLMAGQLGIKRCWFHRGDHYDIPKRRIQEITGKCTLVDSRDIVRIIRGTKTTVS